MSSLWSYGRLACTIFTALALAALSPAPLEAAEVSFEELLGRWCGQQSDYVFSPKQLTITFVPGGQTRVLEIAKVKTTGERISVYWKPEHPKGYTTFMLTTGGQLLVQLANEGGDKGPQRKFIKCKPISQ